MRKDEAREWVESADDDLRWASVSQDAGLASRWCFASQQAAEKILKAFLLAAAGAYPRIHTLPDLLDLVVVHYVKLEALRGECELLDRYYVPARYPGIILAPPFDAERATEALEVARRIVAVVRETMRLEP